MDLNFEQLLATHNQEFKEAEVYSNWMPDDGEYIVSITKLDHDSSSKDGKDLLWWRLTGRIEDVQDEKLNGKEFTVGYYTNRAFGILKGAANMLSGGSVDDLAEANTVLEASLGMVIRAKVITSFSEKYKKDFTNCYIQEVINTTTEVSTEDVPVVDEADNPGDPIETPEVPVDTHTIA